MSLPSKTTTSPIPKKIEKYRAAIEALEAAGSPINESTLHRHLHLSGRNEAEEMLHQWQTWRSKSAVLISPVVSSPPSLTVIDAGAEKEPSTLAECEEIIERGFGYAWRVGDALKQIRDRRLFALNYATFEDYVRDRFHIHRSQAYRWIQAAQFVESLSPIGDMQLPTHESQIRPLLKLSPGDQVIAWRNACASTTGAVTAKTVKASVELIAAHHPEQDGGASLTTQLVVTDDDVAASSTAAHHETLCSSRLHDFRAIDRFVNVAERISAWLTNASANPESMAIAVQRLMETLDEIATTKRAAPLANEDVELGIELLSKLFSSIPGGPE